MSTKTLPLPERLQKGAKKLGEFWKNESERCLAAWSLEVCRCDPKKKFCQARELWLTLAIEAGRQLEDDPHGLIMAMTAAEWDATGLSLKMNHPEVGEIKVGTAQDCVISKSDLIKLMDAPGVLASALRVLHGFPKSKIEGLILPEPPATPAPQASAAAVEINLDEEFA